jgi:hypothetical protein
MPAESRILPMLHSKPVDHATLWIQNLDDGRFEFALDDQILRDWHPQDDWLMRGKLERILEVMHKGERVRWDFRRDGKNQIRDGLVEPSILAMGIRVLAHGWLMLPSVQGP